MVVRYPALPIQLASTSSASRSARRSPAPPLRGFASSRPPPSLPGTCGRAPGCRSSRTRNEVVRPADFLIGTDGTILAANYGEYTDDHWPVDEVLALARRERMGR